MARESTRSKFSPQPEAIHYPVDIKPLVTRPLTWHSSYMFSHYSRFCIYIFWIKPASYCLILKSLMALVLTDVIWCDSCLLIFHPIFRSHCPTDRIRFLLYLSHNAFRATVEINNRMRSIRSSLTCQTPSDSSKSHTIVWLCAPTARFSNRSVKPSNNRAIGRRL